MFMAYLAIGILILLGVIAMLRAYASANPSTLATAAKRTALGSAALGAVLLLLRVPLLGIVFLAVGAALPLALRWNALWPDFAGATGRRSGKTSRVATKHLSMELNHDSGAIEGRVLAGRHRDRRLAELTLEQLLEVREDCQADAESVTLIEAYLDRFQGADWRTRQASGQSSHAAHAAAAAMTREEAYEVLGLAPGASDAEVRDAHHRLMIKLHPDHGGSDYLAAKINQARDLLLGA
jgi:hypothetical protein